MKRGAIIFVFLVLSISYITALNTATQPADTIVISVGGSTLNLNSPSSNFMGTHSYSSVSNVLIGQHDASRIWVSVRDGEMTLLQALSSIHKLCPASTIKSAYTGTVPNPGHNGTEVILSSGKNLQKAINDNDFCGCVPNEIKPCGTSNVCATYPNITCTSAGTWPTCGATYIAPRGTSCSGDSGACDGAGTCQGWSGSGCGGLTIIQYGVNKCISLGSSGSYLVGRNSPSDSWSTNNLNAICARSVGCGTSCSTWEDRTWYLRPGTAAVNNLCGYVASASSGGGSNPTTTTPSTGGGCFLADTPILMANGDFKKIKDIAQGDVVISYDTETDKFVTSTVGKLIIHNGKNSFINDFSKFPLISLSVSIKDKIITLEVTNNHPFYDPVSKEFKQLWKFNIGDKLKTMYGEGIIVGEKKLIDKTSSFSEKATTVYNLEIANGPKNYIANGILVHNSAAKNIPTPGIS